MDARTLPAPLRRYVTPIVTVALAVPVMRLLMDYDDAGVSPPCFAAVLISAWYGGLEAGLLATVLGGLATASVLMPHVSFFVAIQDQLLRLGVFAVVAVLASSLDAATKRAGRAVKAAKEAAEEASTAKSRFIAMLSHELRTPLNPVVTIAGALEWDPGLCRDVREDMTMIRRNVELEMRLIDDLLDLTRIENGKMNLRMDSVDIHEPLSHAIGVCEPEARDKDVILIVELEAKNSLVKGDAMRLQQVFWNLIRNAIKFTPTLGRVHISTQDGPNSGVAVSVSDTGIGIDSNRLTAIFEAFEQGDRDIASRFGGLGLGLAICDALTKAHGGTIKAASDGKGRGATFTVWLPLSNGGVPSNERGQLAKSRPKSGNSPILKTL
jgi:signal transduction histidine kinase